MAKNDNARAHQAILSAGSDQAKIAAITIAASSNALFSATRDFPQLSHRTLRVGSGFRTTCVPHEGQLFFMVRIRTVIGMIRARWNTIAGRIPA